MYNTQTGCTTNEKRRDEPKKMHDLKQKNKALKKCSHELTILNEIAQTLNESVDLHALLDRALRRVADLLHLKTGWILLFDEKSGEPYTAAALNLPPGLQKEPERMNGECYCLDVFKSGNMDDAANVGVVKCSRLHELTLANEDNAGLSYHASIPLITHEKNGDEEISRLGMLNVASSQWRRLTNEELGLLYTIGEILSVAIERARLHARRLESAQTEERLRLAREIHDTIAQNFSAIAFQLEAAKAHLADSENSDKVEKNIDASLELAHKGLEELRRSVHNLRSASLEGRTLSDAIASLVDEYNTRSSTDFRLKSDLPENADRLSPSIETGVYRIVEEALQNIHRHADAERATLTIKISENVFILTIEDNGIGFDYNRIIKTDKKFGLIGMRERINILGGSHRLESLPGAGTRIHVRIPLSQQYPTSSRLENEKR